jgi:hypothetical protein
MEWTLDVITDDDTSTEVGAHVGAVSGECVDAPTAVTEENDWTPKKLS